MLCLIPLLYLLSLRPGLLGTKNLVAALLPHPLMWGNCLNRGIDKLLFMKVKKTKDSLLFTEEVLTEIRLSCVMDLTHSPTSEAV